MSFLRLWIFYAEISQCFDEHSAFAYKRIRTTGERIMNPKSRRKPSRKLFRNEFSNKNSVKLTDFFVDFNSVRMI